MAFYAVRRGRVPGIYRTWEQCEAQVKTFSGAAFKKFPTLAGAEAFLGDAKTPVSVPHPEIMSTPPALPPQPLPTTSTDGEWKAIYTDGACRGNGRAGSVAGVGVWFGDNHPGNISERCPGEQTNNRAELIAIIRALENTETSEKIVIRTDSMYSCSCIELWLPKWRLNDFRTANGKPVKNLPLILYLSELLAAKPLRTFRFEKVLAHSGIHGNECADNLASAGCDLPWRPERDDEWDLSKISSHQVEDPLASEEMEEPSPPDTLPSREQSPPDFDTFSEDVVLSAEELAAELEEG